MSKNVAEVLNASMAKVRDMVDANTVVGSPITVGDVTLIPVSKISFMLGGGGADLGAKTPEAKGSFAGGSGCGVKIAPMAFLCITGDRVRMLPIDEPASSAAERLMEQLPGLVDKVSELIALRRTDVDEI